MTWPLFLIFVVMIIALFFVLSVGMPRFFRWFMTLFLKNSIVSYGKLPTFKPHRSRRFFLFIALVIFGSTIYSNRSLAYCDAGQTGATNFSDCAITSFEGTAYGATYTFYHTNLFPSADQALVVSSSWASGPLAVANNDWSQGVRIMVALGMAMILVMFLDFCRRVVMPKAW